MFHCMHFFIKRNFLFQFSFTLFESLYFFLQLPPTYQLQLWRSCSIPASYPNSGILKLELYVKERCHCSWAEVKCHCWPAARQRWRATDSRQMVRGATVSRQLVRGATAAGQRWSATVGRQLVRGVTAGGAVGRQLTGGIAVGWQARRSVTKDDSHSIPCRRNYVVWSSCWRCNFLEAFFSSRMLASSIFMFCKI